MDIEDLKDPKDKEHCKKSEKRHRAVTYQHHNRMKVVDYTEKCAGGCGNRVLRHGEFCSECQERN